MTDLRTELEALLSEIERETESRVAGFDISIEQGRGEDAVTARVRDLLKRHPAPAQTRQLWVLELRPPGATDWQASKVVSDDLSRDGGGLYSETGDARVALYVPRDGEP